MESNHQPADYKSAALPIEPHQHKFVINKQVEYTKYKNHCQQIFQKK